MKPCDLKIRMPSELKERIANAARANQRSMNGEILIRLLSSMNAEMAAVVSTGLPSGGEAA